MCDIPFLYKNGRERAMSKQMFFIDLKMFIQLRTLAPQVGWVDKAIKGM